nr:MAG TPA: hypothetical protein [Caudoviricetes sp.]
MSCFHLLSFDTYSISKYYVINMLILCENM